MRSKLRLDERVRVFVTGGAGFIGSAVVSQLLDRGHEVVVLDVVHPSAHQVEPAIDKRAEFLRADVRDHDAVDNALSGVDAVCHQAAIVGLGVDLNDLPLFVANNDLGTAVLLAAMARARITRLVLASSMVVYGEGAYACVAHGSVVPGPRRQTELLAGQFEPPCPQCGRSLQPGFVTETAPLDPRSVYAATKVAQEHLASAWATGTGGSVIALRYHNVYGPGMPRDTPYAGVAAIFRSSLAAGLAPEVFEDGGQRRDFVHVRDVAMANVLALEAVGAPGLAPYNIGSGEVHTIGDMARVLAAATGGPQPLITGRFRKGDVRHVTASSARAQEILGYRPSIGFEAGIREFAKAQLRGN
jgi:dTDP-L-rhamnose 4-epimerase